MVDELTQDPRGSTTAAIGLVFRSAWIAALLIVVYYTGRHGLAFFYQGF